MDPSFIARLERQARAKQGRSPRDTDPDSAIHPPPLSSESDRHPHQAPNHEDSQAEDDQDGDDEDDDDEALRIIGELPEELEDHHLTHLDTLVAQPSVPNEPSDEHDSGPPNEEAEEDEDDGTTDSDQDEPRPKKPEPIPTIRLTLALPTRLPLQKPVEQSVSLLAKQAGYTLPADTAITFGASAVPEPERPPPLNPDTSTDIPPPKRRRRRRVQERDEGYDKDDPFVDDSEAFIMEPKYYHPPARDGFFVACGALELKSDSRQTRVRKQTAKAPKKQPLGEPPPNPPGASDLPKPKQRVPLNTVTVPESSSSAPPNPLPQPPPPRQKPIHAKQSDPAPATEERPRPVPAPVPSNLSTPQSQKPAPQPQPSTSTAPTPRPPQPSTSEAPTTSGTALPPQPSTSKAPTSGTGLPPPPSTSTTPSSDKVRPITAQLSHPDTPRPTNGEARSGTTQAPPKTSHSPVGSFTQTPRQPPSTSQRHSGTPHDPICLGDDEERQMANQSSSKMSQAPTHEPGPSFMAVAASPFNHTSRVRPPYLKARSLPERTAAGPLPQPIEDALDRLKIEIEAASPFIPKKFPNELKPSTIRVAQLALDMNEYDECFFIRLAQLFPYNTFTIKKFVKREILPQRKAYYESEINQRIARLKQMIIEGMPAARADHDAAMRQYEKAKREYDERLPGESSAALPANASTILGDTVMNNSFNAVDQSTTEPAEKPPKLPVKLFKLTLPIRELIYELIKLEDELCETIKDTQKIVDKNVTLKDTSNRRQFYLRLAHLWPDDFMTTNKLSREVANMKKKHEGPLGDPQNLITLQ